MQRKVLHFQKLLKFSSLGVVAFILASCGMGDGLNKKKTGAPEVSELNALFVETPCLPKEGQQESLKEVDALISDINRQATLSASFSRKYFNQFFIHIRPPQHIGTQEMFLVGPENALVFSVKKLREDFKQVKLDWDKELGAFNSETFKNEKALERLESTEELEKINQRIHFLKKKVERLKAVSCAMRTLKNREKQDVRPLYILKKKISEGAHIEEDSDVLRPLLLEMCNEYNTDAICSVDFMLRKRQRQLDVFYRKQVEHFEKRKETFFKPFKATKWQCHQENGQTIIEVVINPDKELKELLFNRFDVLTEFVEKRWSSQNVKVRLKWSGEASRKVSIKWSNGGLSYVDKERPYEIVLSRKMTFSKTLLVFAHELGHVLGLPDCYHEFYDSKEKAVIYYTLDKSGKNLMCHLDEDADITPDALRAMSEKVCL